MVLCVSIIKKYCVQNPKLIGMEKILRKNVEKYNKMLEFHHIVCKWKLQFVDTTIHGKSKRQFSNRSRWRLLRYWKRKIE